MSDVNVDEVEDDEKSEKMVKYNERFEALCDALRRNDPKFSDGCGISRYRGIPSPAKNGRLINCWEWLVLPMPSFQELNPTSGFGHKN